MVSGVCTMTTWCVSDEVWEGWRGVNSNLGQAAALAQHSRGQTPAMAQHVGRAPLGYRKFPFPGLVLWLF